MIARLDSRAFPFVLAIMLAALAVLAARLFGNSPAQQALLAARWTARAMFPIFLVIFLARPIVRLWPAPWLRAILRHRRQWGLAFALAMTVHLAALLINILGFHPRPWPSLIGGGVGYAFVYLMALTSNDGAARAMGKGWRWLHSIGLYFVWFIFLVSYSGREAQTDPAYHYTGWLMTRCVIAAMALRLYALLPVRQKRTL